MKKCLNKVLPHLQPIFKKKYRNEFTEKEELFFLIIKCRMIFSERERKRFIAIMGIEDQIPIFTSVLGFDYD